MFVINFLGLLLIGAVIWWFWLYKPDETEVNESELVVSVENGTYHPSRLKLSPDKAVTVQFLRKDASPCSEMLLIPALEVSESLPLNKVKNITLPALKSGEYEFHCQMQMYRGKLIVK